MNDFTAKKLGEVFAFVELVIDTQQKGKDGFLQAIDQATYDNFVAEATALRDRIGAAPQEFDKDQVMKEKSARTLAKITKARDEYINGSWDDPIELYEWLSFNAGAGTGHASEVAGAAKAMGNDKLLELNEDATRFFDTLLETCKTYLHQAGQDKATL